MSDYNLYLKIIDGQPIDHPHHELNLICIYGSVENISLDFQPFLRIPQPPLPNPYVNPVASYQQINGVWQDVWSFVEMSNDEKTAVLQKYIDNAISTVERLKISAQTMLSNNQLTNDQITVWQKFSNDLESWSLQDPINPKIPDIPPKVLLET